MAVPTLTCENRMLNRNDRRKTEAAEMKFLRSLTGYRPTDQKCNNDIRTDLSVYHLGKKKKKTQETRLVWTYPKDEGEWTHIRTSSV
jgi:hypothetical protein